MMTYLILGSGTLGWIALLGFLFFPVKQKSPDPEEG